jgi:trehalose-phosphatase
MLFSWMKSFLEWVRQVFAWADSYLPFPFFEMLVTIPKGDEDKLYELAAAYRQAAERFQQHSAEVTRYIGALRENWDSDGARAAVAKLEAYQARVNSAAAALKDMGDRTHETAVAIESAKYMAIVNLGFLIYVLFWAIPALIPSAGASGLVALAQAVRTRTVLAAIWQHLKTVILNMSVRETLYLGWQRARLFGAFTAGSKLAIHGLLELEGHSPTFKPGQFLAEVGESMAAGFIGGRLTAGKFNPFSEGLAMAGGQFGVNLIAASSYDPERKLSAGVAQAGLFGTVMGIGGLRPERMATAGAELPEGQPTALARALDWFNGGKGTPAERAPVEGASSGSDPARMTGPVEPAQYRAEPDAKFVDGNSYRTTVLSDGSYVRDFKLPPELAADHAAAATEIGVRTAEAARFDPRQDVQPGAEGKPLTEGAGRPVTVVTLPDGRVLVHTGELPMARVADVSPQAVSAQAVSAQAVSAQAVSAQAVSAQTVSPQAVSPHLTVDAAIRGSGEPVVRGTVGEGLSGVLRAAWEPQFQEAYLKARGLSSLADMTPEVRAQYGADAAVALRQFLDGGRIVRYQADSGGVARELPVTRGEADLLSRFGLRSGTDGGGPRDGRDGTVSGAGDPGRDDGSGTGAGPAGDGRPHAVSGADTRWERQSDGWYEARDNGTLHLGTDADGRPVTVEIPRDARAVVDSSGELRLVVTEGASYDRGLDGRWSERPADGSSGVLVDRLMEPVRLPLTDGRVLEVRSGEAISDRSTDGTGVVTKEPVAYRGTEVYDGANRADAGMFVRTADGRWEAVSARAAQVEAWLASADRAYEPARLLYDIAGRSDERLPVDQRLEMLPESKLTDLLLRGSKDDAAAAVYELVRREEGKSLRWTQFDAADAMLNGRIVDMAAGEGKSLAYLTANARAAVATAEGPNAGPVRMVLTRDTLASREFGTYQKMFESHGIDIVRIRQNEPIPEPRPGRPTIQIGAQDELAFNILGDRSTTPRDGSVRSFFDELDEAFLYKNSRYIMSEGVAEPAPKEVADNVNWARDFLDSRLKDGSLSEADFGREPGQVGGPGRLTEQGEARVRDLLKGELSADELNRLNMAAAGKWEYVEGVHYVVYRGKVVIIDQVTHQPMLDLRTETAGVGQESRWNGGLAQAIEAKHNLPIRSDPTSTKSLTLRELAELPENESITGASGTAKGKEDMFGRLGLPSDIHEVPRYYDPTLKSAPDKMYANEAAKLDGIVADVKAMQKNASGEPGRPQWVIADRNDLVGKLSERLTAAGVEHVAIDAHWFLEHGAGWEEAFAKVEREAGALGKVTVINMQGARGVDPHVSPEALAQGGLQVRTTSRSAISPDIDVQASNRAARSGQPGSDQYYGSPEDAVYRLSPNRDVELAIIQYRSAVEANRPEAVEQAATVLREMRPDLQRQAEERYFRQLNSSYLPNAPPGDGTAPAPGTRPAEEPKPPPPQPDLALSNPGVPLPQQPGAANSPLASRNAPVAQPDLSEPTLPRQPASATSPSGSGPSMYGAALGLPSINPASSQRQPTIPTATLPTDGTGGPASQASTVPGLPTDLPGGEGVGLPGGGGVGLPGGEGVGLPGGDRVGLPGGGGVGLPGGEGVGLPGGERVGLSSGDGRGLGTDKPGPITPTRTPAQPVAADEPVSATASGTAGQTDPLDTSPPMMPLAGGQPFPGPVGSASPLAGAGRIPSGSRRRPPVPELSGDAQAGTAAAADEAASARAGVRPVTASAVPGEAAPVQAGVRPVTASAVPGEAVPGEAVPGEAAPAQAGVRPVTAAAVPSEAVPGEAVPGSAGEVWVAAGGRALPAHGLVWSPRTVDAASARSQARAAVEKAARERAMTPAVDDSDPAILPPTRGGRLATAVMLPSGSVHSFVADPDPVQDHWLLRQVMERLPPGSFGAFGLDRSVIGTLSALLEVTEHQFRAEWGAPAWWDPLQRRLYRRDFADFVRETWNGGLVATYRELNDGQLLEARPGPVPDQLLAEFGLRRTYVDQMVELTEVDRDRGVITMLERNDPLRTAVANLSTVDRDFMVLAVHAELVPGGGVLLQIGNEQVSVAEFARVLELTIERNPDLRGRKLLLVACDAAVPYWFGREPTSMAAELARLSGVAVAGAEGLVWVREDGRAVIASNEVPGTAEILQPVRWLLHEPYGGPPQAFDPARVLGRAAASPAEVAQEPARWEVASGAPDQPLPAGADGLARWLADKPRESVLALDFDGTLARIVSEPGAARALPLVRQMLSELVNRGVRVAVVSGRQVEFLRERLPVPGVKLVGLYGMEVDDGAGTRVTAEVPPFIPAVRQALAAVAADTPVGQIPGVFVEDKGLSVAVHWRGVTDRGLVAEGEAALGRIAAELGLAVESGKEVTELKPLVDLSKREALLAAVAEFGQERPVSRVAFVGDDLGDGPAFEALDRLAASGVEVQRVAVGSPALSGHGPTARPPAELLDRADVVLDGPVQVRSALIGAVWELHARSEPVAAEHDAVGVSGRPGVRTMLVVKSPLVDFKGLVRLLDPNESDPTLAEVPLEDLRRLAAMGYAVPSAGGVVSGLLPLLDPRDAWVAQPADAVTWRLSQQAGGPVVVRTAGKLLELILAEVSPEQVESATKFWNGWLWPHMHSFDRSGIHYTRYTEEELSRYLADYLSVNQAMADSVRSVADFYHLMWIHDYQNEAVARMMAELGLPRPAYFHHIPWPPVGVLEAGLPRPALEQLANWMAGHRTVYFHTEISRANFLDLAERFGGGVVHRRTGWVLWPGEGRASHVGVSPITTDPTRFDSQRDNPAAVAMEDRIRAQKYPDGPNGRSRPVIYAGGRGDPSKNWINTLLAIERARELDPGLMRDVVVVLNEQPTRADLEFYRDHQNEIDDLIGRLQAAQINITNYGPSPYGPMVGFKLADVVLLPTHQDGLNLMAVEALMEAWLGRDRVPRPAPIPVLGEAGIAEQLGPRGAPVVDPRSVDSIAEGILRVLRMTPEERVELSAQLQEAILGRTNRDWAQEQLDALATGGPHLPAAELAGDPLLRLIDLTRRLELLGLHFARLAGPDAALPPGGLSHPLARFIQHLAAEAGEVARQAGIEVPDLRPASLRGTGLVDVAAPHAPLVERGRLLLDLLSAHQEYSHDPSPALTDLTDHLREAITSVENLGPPAVFEPGKVNLSLLPATDARIPALHELDRRIDEALAAYRELPWAREGGGAPLDQRTVPSAPAGPPASEPGFWDGRQPADQSGRYEPSSTVPLESRQFVGWERVGVDGRLWSVPLDEVPGPAGPGAWRNLVERAARDRLALAATDPDGVGVHRPSPIAVAVLLPPRANHPTSGSVHSFVGSDGVPDHGVIRELLNRVPERDRPPYDVVNALTGMLSELVRQEEGPFEQEYRARMAGPNTWYTAEGQRHYRDAFTEHLRDLWRGGQVAGFMEINGRRVELRLNPAELDLLAGLGLRPTPVVRALEQLTVERGVVNLLDRDHPLREELKGLSSGDDNVAIVVVHTDQLGRGVLARAGGDVLSPREVAMVLAEAVQQNQELAGKELLLAACRGAATYQTGLDWRLTNLAAELAELTGRPVTATEREVVVLKGGTLTVAGEAALPGGEVVPERQWLRYGPGGGAPQTVDPSRVLGAASGEAFTPDRVAGTLGPPPGSPPNGRPPNGRPPNGRPPNGAPSWQRLLGAYRETGPAEVELERWRAAAADMVALKAPLLTGRLAVRAGIAADEAALDALEGIGGGLVGSGSAGSAIVLADGSVFAVADEPAAPHPAADHWAIQVIADEIPAELRSPFDRHGTVHRLLSAIADRAERDVLARSGRSDPAVLRGAELDAHQATVRTELHRRLAGSQLAGYRAPAEGQLREVLPSAGEDALLTAFRIRPAYAGRILDRAEVSTERSLVILAEYEDPLRAVAASLAGTRPDWLVLTVHGERSPGGVVTARFGDTPLTARELSRVLDEVDRRYPTLSERNVLLLACEAGTAYPLVGADTSLARELAELRPGRAFAGPVGPLSLSDAGHVYVGAEDPAVAWAEARYTRGAWRVHDANTPPSGAAFDPYEVLAPADSNATPQWWELAALAPPDAGPVRQGMATAAVRAAVDEAVRQDLVDASWLDGTVLRIGRDPATADLPMADVIAELATRPLPAQTLAVEAAALYRVVERIATEPAAAAVNLLLGRRWPPLTPGAPTPVVPAAQLATAVAASAVLAAAARLPRNQARAYLDGLRWLVAELPAEEALAVFTTATDPVQDGLTVPVAEALVRDAGERLSRLGGSGLVGLSEEAAGTLRTDLARWLGAGPVAPELDRVRAVTALQLGFQAGAWSGRPGIEGGLNALGELWRRASDAERTILAGHANDILLDHPEDTLRRAELSPAARALVAAAVPEAARPVERDPFLSSQRAAHLEPLLARLRGDVAELAATIGASDPTQPVALPRLAAARTQELAWVLRLAQTWLRGAVMVESALSEAARPAIARQAQLRADAEAATDLQADARVRGHLRDERRAEVDRQRHAAAMRRYQAVLDRANNAADAAGRLAAELDELTGAANPTVARANQLLTELRNAVGSAEGYRDGLRTIQPEQLTLSAGMPMDRLPFLRALAMEINQQVAVNGGNGRIGPGEIERVLRAVWPEVSTDGTVIRVGDAEAEVRWVSGEPVRAPGSRGVIELIEGLMPQQFGAALVLEWVRQLNREIGGSLSLADAVGRAADAAADTVLDPLAGAVLRTVGDLARRHLNLGGGASWSWSRSLHTSGSDFSLNGAVADLRGPADTYHVSGHYEVRVRTPDRLLATDRPSEAWSPWRTVDQLVGSDQGELVLALQHPYSDPAPVRQVRSANPDLPGLPQHVVSAVSGLRELREGLADTLAAHPRFRGAAGRTLRAELLPQLDTLVFGEYPGRFGETTVESRGLVRVISQGGVPVATVRLSTRLGGLSLVGASSADYHLETVRVDVAALGGVSERGQTTRYSGHAGVRSGPGGGGVGGASGTLTTARATERTSSVESGSFAYYTRVIRDLRSTGYRGPVEHIAEIEMVDPDLRLLPGDSVRTVSVPGEVLLRIGERNAYRHGLPVPEEAVEIRDGVERHRDEPSRGTGPERRLLTRPSDGRPMYGAAQVLRMTGVDGPSELADQVRNSIERLIERGELDTGTSSAYLDSLTHQRVLRELASVNLENKLASLTLPEGVVFTLGAADELGRSNAVVIRMAMPDRLEYTGLGSAHVPLFLPISSSHLNSVHGTAYTAESGWAVGGTGPVRAGPVTTGGMDLGRSTSARRAASELIGDRLNWVSMHEAAGLPEGTAYFRAPGVRYEAWLRRRDGTTEPLGRSTGDLEFVVDRAFTTEVRPNGPAEPEAVALPAGTPARVLDHATVVDVDSGGLWPALVRRYPELTIPSTAPFNHLRSLVSENTIAASLTQLVTEWGFGTDLAVAPGQAVQPGSLVAPTATSIWLRARPVAAELLGAAPAVSIGDGTFWLPTRVTAAEAGQAGRWSGSATAALGDAFGADTTPGTLTASLDRTGTAAERRYQLLIAGPERLTVDTGVAYTMRMSFDVELGRPGEWTASGAQLSAVFTLPERHALGHYGDGRLGLPRAQVSDAITRYVAGNGGGAVADHDTMTRVLDRFAGQAADGPPGDADRALVDAARAVVNRDAAAVTARGPAGLPAYLDTMIGGGGVENWRLTDPATGREAELLTTIAREIEAVAPGELDRAANLRQGLVSLFGAGRAPALIDNMLGPGGYELVLSTAAGPVTVAIRADFIGEPRPLGQIGTAGQILQHYRYTEHGVVSTRISERGGGGAGGLPGVVDPRAGAQAHVARSVSAGAATQITEVQRTDSFGPGLLRIGRDLSLQVSVRSPEVAREPVHLSLSLVHLVMDDRRAGTVGEVTAVGDAAVPVEGPNPPPVGRVVFTEGVRANLTGAVADVLTRDNWPVKAAALGGSPLSPRALAAALPMAMEPEGAEIARVPVPGHPGRWLAVRLRAQLGRLLEPVTERDNVGVGSIVRDQRTSTGSASMTGTLAYQLAASQRLLSGSLAPGTSSKITTALGKRMERSWYARTDGYTGRYEVHFGFELTLEQDQLARGGSTVQKRVSYPNVATGEAVLTVHGTPLPHTGQPDLGTRPWRPLSPPVQAPWGWTQWIRPWRR